MNINAIMKKYLEDNFSLEISNIENEAKVEISFVDDINLGNSEITIEEGSESKKEDKKKPKKKTAKKRASTIKKKNSTIKKNIVKSEVIEDQIISPIKEIKDKKSGWWQK